jgi:hypothetical protein
MDDAVWREKHQLKCTLESSGSAHIYTQIPFQNNTRPRSAEFTEVGLAVPIYLDAI